MDLAAGHLERHEQRGGAVAGIVMGHAGGQSGPHRQRRLGAVKCLDLRLFVHAQHQRPFGRVQIEADDVGQFGVEFRVAAELEGLDPVRLQTVLLPDAMHGHEAEADLLGQTPRAPMGGVLGRAHGRRYYRQFLSSANPARPSAAMPALEAREPFALVTPSPQTHRALGYAQALGDHAERMSFRALHHDARPHAQRLRQSLRPQPRRQLRPIGLAHYELRLLHTA